MAAKASEETEGARSETNNADSGFRFVGSEGENLTVFERDSTRVFMVGCTEQEWKQLAHMVTACAESKDVRENKPETREHLKNLERQAENAAVAARETQEPAVRVALTGSDIIVCANALKNYEHLVSSEHANQEGAHLTLRSMLRKADSYL